MRKFSSPISLVVVLLAFVSLIASLGACVDGVEETPVDLTINFTHVVGDDALSFQDTTYTNAAGNEFTVWNLKYYVTNLGVVGVDVSDEIPERVYVDAADETTTSLTFAVLPGTLSQVSFTFGVDEELNETGAFGDDIVDVNMAWPDTLGGGYHYMKLEGTYQTGEGMGVGYGTHLGRTTVDEVPHPFAFTVSLDADVIVENDASVDVVMDIMSWFETPNTYDLTTWPSAIMDNVDAQETLSENGFDVFSLGN